MALFRYFKREKGNLPDPHGRHNGCTSIGSTQWVWFERKPRRVPRARAQNGFGFNANRAPRNFFHEIAKITTFTKILPLEKYPLDGAGTSFVHVGPVRILRI